MMGPQMSAIAVWMKGKTAVSNTEEIELVLVVSSLGFRPDVKMSGQLLEILISCQENQCYRCAWVCKS